MRRAAAGILLASEDRRAGALGPAYRRAIAALVLAMLLPAAAHAQRATVQDRLTEAFETALREHDVFLNCSATDRPAHTLIRRGWDDMVGDSLRAMAAANVDADLVRRLRERTDAEKMIRRDARYGEILELCSADWMDRAINFKYLMLNVRVREILDSK